MCIGSLISLVEKEKVKCKVKSAQTINAVKSETPIQIIKSKNLRLFGIWTKTWKFWIPAFIILKKRWGYIEKLGISIWHFSLIYF